MRREMALLLIVAMILADAAIASNYMYEKASVKGVRYKNVEMGISSTQSGFSGSVAAADDSYVSERAITVPSPGVLGNDVGSGLAVTDYTQPDNGAVSMNPDGSFTYTPYSGFCGIDSFTYTVSGQSQISPRPEIDNYERIDPDYSEPYMEPNQIFDVPLVIAAGYYPENMTLDVPLRIMQSYPSDYLDSFNMISSGEQYLENELDESTYMNRQFDIPTASVTPSAMAYYDTATVTIDVRSCPVVVDAIDDFYSTKKGSSIAVPSPGVLGNDRGSRLTVVDYSNPTNGVVSVNSDGSFSYSPNTNFAGTDRFTYTISSTAEADLNSNVIGVAHIGWLSRDSQIDSQLKGRHAEYGRSMESLTGSITGSDTATVTIDVIRDPIIVNEIDAVDDAFSTKQNTPLTIPSTGMLVNDRGESLNVIGYTNPSNGAIIKNRDGSITYSPKAGFRGVDSFVYTISGRGREDKDEDSARVTVDVIGGGERDPDSSWADYGKECDEGQFTIGFMFEALKGGFQVNTNMVGNKRYVTGFLNNGNGSLSVYIFKEYEDGSQKTLIERLVDYSPSAIVPVVIKYDLGHFQVFFNRMDEELSQPFIDYTDSSPLPSGKIDFESLKDSSVNLSNVVTICSSSLVQPVSMGIIHFEETDPSYLINGTSDDPFADWGEVPANQILFTIDINMNFQEARSLARQLASALEKATNQNANVVGEMEFINLFQIETQGRTLEDLIRDVDFAESYSSQIHSAFPNQRIYPEHSLRDLESSVYSNEAYGKGYQMIGVQDAWRQIDSYNKQFSKVVVGVVDDGIYLGDGQFNNSQIDTSIKIYQNPPCCELSSHLPKFAIPGSHGTGIASILAADADNGLQGIASCLPKDKLRIFMINISREGGGFVTSSMLAFQYEIQNGSSIISCSMGKTDEVDPGAAEMYDEFFTKLANNTTFDSVLFIFSAGNEGKAPKGEERIPNGLPTNKSLSNVITVGNILNDGNISAGQLIKAGTDQEEASKSNKAGRDYEVTLAAPGEQSVWGLYNNKIQNYLGGTSMATPHVTAAAALMRSIDPCLTAGDIKAILIKTSRNKTGDTPAPQDLGGRILAIDEALNETIRHRSPRYCTPFLNGESIFLPGDYDTYDEIYGSTESSAQPVLPVTAKPQLTTQPSTALSTTITIISTQYKGYTIQVDGQTIGTEGQGQDALDGRYTFSVSGNQQHHIRVDHPMNWKWWQYFYNAGETIVYDF